MCNFPMNLQVRLLVGWSVCHYFLQGRDTLPCSYRSTCFALALVSKALPAVGVVVGREAPGAAFQLELVAVLVLKVSDRKNHEVYIFEIFTSCTHF